jgi:putative heme-binding domain-containing protein
MLRILGEFGRTNEVPALLSILGNAKEPEPVRLAALSALRRFDDDRIATAVLAGYSTFPPAVRPHAIDLLIGRLPWTLRLVTAVDRGLIAPADISMDQLRQISLHNDYGVNQLVQKRWGKISGGTAEEKLAEVRRFNNDLRAAAGDSKAGRELFKNACAVCHKLFDEGGAVGPDLTHANRSDRNYLLISIVDPSSVVRAEHLSYLLRTTDGRVLSGLLVEQSQASVTLLDAKGERITVARDKVQTLKESPVSLMPEGLLSAMNPQELRDLFAYLQSNH